MYKTRKELKKSRIENAQMTEDGLSHHEIAKILGITAAEVRRIEHEALKKLKHPEMAKSLIDHWRQL